MTTTILAMATEDGHYDAYLNGTIGSGIAVDTTAGHFLSQNRCGLQVFPNAGSAAVFISKNLTASSTFWVGARACLNAYNTGPLPLLTLVDSGNVTRIIVQPTDASNDPLKVYKQNAAGSLTLLFTASTGLTLTPAGGPDKIDLDVSYGTSGHITLYVNGTPAGTYSGDVTTDGATTISSVRLGPGNFRSNVSVTWSGLLIRTTSTLGVDVMYRPPATLGDTDQWTGGVANVGNQTVSATSYDTASAASQVQLYKPAAQVPTNAVVVAVADVVPATAGASGTLAHIQLLRKVGGTLYPATTQPLPAAGATANITQIWDVNPATGVAWTPTDLNASTYQFGYESGT